MSTSTQGTHAAAMAGVERGARLGAAPAPVPLPTPASVEALGATMSDVGFASMGKTKANEEVLDDEAAHAAALREAGGNATVWRLLGAHPQIRRASDLTGTLGEAQWLPLPPGLLELIGASGVRRGITVQVTGSALLSLELVRSVIQAGGWGAAAGVGDLGMVAAAEAGVDLRRLILIPSVRGTSWAGVLAVLLDGFGVVIVGPHTDCTAVQARRLQARARERASILVVPESWPYGTDLRLGVLHRRWEGLGWGHGYLKACQAQVRAEGRAVLGAARTRWLWLPAADGRVALCSPVAKAAPKQRDPAAPSVSVPGGPAAPRGLVAPQGMSEEMVG